MSEPPEVETHDYLPDLDRARKDGVLTTSSALTHMTRGTLRWRIESGRWQQPCRGIVVAHSGPLTSEQKLWVASLWAGPGAALGGLTAAKLWGLRGFDDTDDTIHVVLPPGREQKAGRPRDNRLKLQGYDTLRYAAFAIRYCSGYVAAQIRTSLRDSGIEC